MDELNYIGKLFRDSLKDHTIEPSDKVWANIQQRIGASPQINAKAKFSKFLISGAAVISIIIASVAVVYLINNNDKKSTSNPTTQNTTINTPAQQVETTQPVVLNPSTQTTVEKGTNSNEKKAQTVIGIVKPISNNTTVIDPIISNFALANNNTIQHSAEKTAIIPAIVSSKERPILPKDNIDKPINTDNIKTNITLDITPDTTVCMYDMFKIRAKGGSSILWSNGSITDEITINSLNEEQELVLRATIKTPTGDTNITINIKAVDCQTNSQPNAFTPNGDQINDVFIPRIKGVYSDYSLMIYNRNGVKVFESKVLEHGWDGKQNGVESTEGAYFYAMLYRDANGAQKNIRGTIVLLRR
ncbi:MAG: gliding motility-associated C-terminal domain-containing protein [Bacteroidota bacterium]